MGIVDAEDSATTRLVQCQRVGDAVRPRCIRRHAPRLDFDPVAAANLGQEAVEVDQTIKAPIAPTHAKKISGLDNNLKGRGLAPRVVDEVEGVDRVLYDVTLNPLGAIE